jgi:hypothetical protein
VQKDCTMWLDDVERALPTVVFSVKEANGKELSAVRVSEAGKALAASLDGVAIAMNPGPHAFRFDAPDGRSVEHQVVVREGQKAFIVTAILPRAPEAAPAAVTPPPPKAAPPPVEIAPAPAPATVTAGGAPSPTTEPVSSPQSGQGPSRTAAYAAGGVGVAGIVVGSITGLMAMGKKSTADQNCVGSECNPTGKDAGNSGKSLATVSTVAFGVGLAGLAVGTILWFTAKPASTEAPSTGVRAWHAGIEPLPAGGIMLSTGRTW